uniref:Putative conserved plasma membrane protein n=1 Tax=Corethrella appendiculata TaxID=1370023 RepID=U5EQH1_9DIPT
MKKAAKNLLYDRLHRGVVYTCMGLTVVGCYLLSCRVYRYFTVIKPMKQEAELKMIQEGSYSKLDTASTLKT